MTSNQKNPNKKKHIISLRLDEETYQTLNDISNKNNISQSLLLRDSFKKWVNIKNILIKSNSIIVGDNFLRGLFNFANDEQIINLAKNIAEIWINEFNIHLIDIEARQDLDSMLTALINGIGPNEANWFNQISYRKIKKDKILVYGIHSLSKGFSLYFKTFLEYVMNKEFSYKIIPEESKISGSTIRLQFKISQNQLE
ncbi:MAG: hypothetical protein ACQERB_07250 [Promethearchaeati archaeon]